jgi:hypothetical protein
MLKAVLGGGNGQGEDGGSALWRMRGALPTSLRSAFTRVMPGSVNRRIVEHLYLSGTDWSRTRAFVVPGETHGFVRLNLRGRERDGIVEPGDADGLLDEIADGLASFSDPDGQPAVAGTERPRERWPSGAHADDLPDLLVRWSDRPSVEVRQVTSPRFGEVRRPGVGTGWPGNHCDEAWALVVPGAARLREPARPPRVVDIAATAAAAAGADRDGLAGEPLLEFTGAPRSIAAA